MAGSMVGYVRVSTTDQNCGRQLEGIVLDKVFEDKVSGWSINREGWKQCKEYLRDGDTLHVHSIDRLARNLEDLQRNVRELTEKGVTVRFVKENLTFKGKNNPFQVLMFQMVGAFAQFERELIKERQREGIEKAKKEGKHLGRPAKLTPAQWEEIRTSAEQGVPKVKLAKQYGIRREYISTILNKKKVTESILI
jgi:DNA invertase Pin-like site-specific DNA recombinase